jgi:Domain of unknown function (DUF4214)/RTX calcium-binding nonapeptide repeat (4 copies)
MEIKLYEAANKYGLTSMSCTTETIAYNITLLGSVTNSYFSTPKAIVGVTTTLTQEYSSGVKVVWTNLLYSDTTHATYSGLYTYAIATNELLSATIGPLSLVVGQVGDPNITYAAADRIFGNSYNNTVRGYGGNDVIDGGGGIDTAVYSGIRTDYTISFTSSAACSVTDKIANRDGADILANGERLQFIDTMLAIDIGANQIAGSGYMLYKAAFNRTPDAGGLGYWISKMDGGMSYSDVAKNFVTSAEFKTAFGGSNPSVNTLVTKLYNNVLNRTPDSGGLAFWQDKLNTGWSTADVLGFFSTSGENVTNVTPLIANGISYTQFVG